MVFLDCVGEENGGGIDCGDSSPIIKGCKFINTVSGAGGGIYAAGSGSPTITDCMFVNNTVAHIDHGGRGGAITVSETASAFVANCIFIDCASENQGGSVFVDEGASITIVNCTFVGSEAPDGSSLYVSDTGQLTLVNSIVAFGEDGEAAAGPGGFDVTHCNVFGNTGGDWAGPIAGMSGSNGNISNDPLFVDAENGDIHLYYHSPCRDMGDATVSGLPDDDMEGDPRVSYGLVDMGADEFCTHLYCTGDFTPSGSVVGKLVGLPGTTPTGLVFGTSLYDPPAKNPWGTLYIEPPWVVVPLTDPIPPEGILFFPDTVPATPAAPNEIFVQALIGLNPDSLTNLLILHIR